MIRLFVVAFLLFPLTGSVANADKKSELTTLNKPVVCGEVSYILNILTSSKLREKPIVTGIDTVAKTGYVVFVNEKNGSITIIEMNGKTACILGMGTNLRVLLGKPA